MKRLLTETARWSTRLRWPLTLAVLLMIPMSVLAYRTYVEYRRQSEMLAEIQAADRLRETLEQTVSIHFGGEVPLAQWLDEFTRQSGLAVEVIEQTSEDSADPGLRAFVRSLAKTKPLWLDLPPLLARDAIQSLADFHEVHWMLRSDGVIVLGNEAIDELRTAHVVEVLPADFGQSQVDHPERHFGNSTWDWDISGNYLHAVPGAAVCVQSDRDQWRAREFLKRLAAASEQIQSIPPVGLSADDPAWQPIYLAGEPASFERLTAALDRPITLHVVDMPWCDFVAKLAELARFPITLHPRAQHWAEGNHQLVTCKLEETPLRDALSEAARTQTLDFQVAAGAKLLFVTTHAQAELWQAGALLAYPVGDLTSGGKRTELTSDLINLLIDACEPESWLGNGGAAVIHPHSNGDLLLIAQRLDLHRKVQQTLTAIRAARAGEWESAHITSLSPATRDAQARLQKSASLEFAGMNLRDALRELNERFDLRLRMDGSLTENTSRFYRPIRCYLPRRPLQENLSVLLQSVKCQYLHDGDELRVVPSDFDGYDSRPPPNEMQVMAIDLRPWLYREQEPEELCELIRKVSGGNIWQDDFGPAAKRIFRETLVVNAPPHVVPRVRDFLAALSDHCQPGSPRKWCGETLTGEALGRPLKLFAPTEEFVKRQLAIEEKLRTRVTIEPATMKLWDALSTLASRYELPLVMYEFNASASPQARVNVVADNQPLGEVIQSLLGDPRYLSLSVVDGCALIIPGDDSLAHPAGHLYSVDDLLQPRGPLLPGTLMRTLGHAFKNVTFREKYASARLHFGNLFWLEYDQVNQLKLEQTLRQLRSGELQPLPEIPADARGPYYIEASAP